VARGVLFLIRDMAYKTLHRDQEVPVWIKRSF
jgi:hypothetical protein